VITVGANGFLKEFYSGKVSLLRQALALRYAWMNGKHLI